MTVVPVSCEVAFSLLAAVFAATMVLAPGLDAAHWAAPVSIWLAAIWISWQDLTDFTIPDGAVIALGLLGAAHRIAADGLAAGATWHAATLHLVILDFVLAGGCVLAVREAYYRFRGHDGIGFGDVKLAAAGGVLVGASGFALALFAASVAGLIVAGWRRRWNAEFSASDRIAFGAVLTPVLSGIWTAQNSFPLAGFLS